MLRNALAQTAVLRMFDVKLAVFKMKLLGYWSKEGVLLMQRHDSTSCHTPCPLIVHLATASCATLCAAGDYEVIADDDDDDESELEEVAGDVAAEEEDEEAAVQNSKRQRQ